MGNSGDIPLRWPENRTYVCYVPPIEVPEMAIGISL